MSDALPIQIQQTLEPPCPRVNTWAEGYPPGPFLTTAQRITLTQPKDAAASGIDIFFWKYQPPTTQTVDGQVTIIPGRKGQACEFTATGNYTFSQEDAGENLDQTKFQLRYTEPGDYSITIRVYNVD